MPSEMTTGSISTESEYHTTISALVKTHLRSHYQSIKEFDKIPNLLDFGFEWDSWKSEILLSILVPLLTQARYQFKFHES
jgi:hypothetical protein